jgi:hypothetical protein
MAKKLFLSLLTLTTREVAKMAKNRPYGDNARKGAVKDRSQFKHPKTGLYIKRDNDTGRFMDQKTSGGKFKGVRTEK